MKEEVNKIINRINEQIKNELEILKKKEPEVVKMKLPKYQRSIIYF